MPAQEHYTSDTSEDTSLYGQLVLQALMRGHMCRRMEQAMLLHPNLLPFTSLVRRLIILKGSGYSASWDANFADFSIDSSTAFLQN